jgi:hypothetical protein
VQTENKRQTVDDIAVAAALGVSVSTVRHDRLGARRIPFYRIGGSIRYDLDRVWEALAALEVGGVALPSKRRSKAAA